MFKGEESITFIKDGYRVAVLATRSEGAEGAFMIYIDTNFEPDGSDSSPGLRIIVNDSDAYECVPYKREGE